MVAVGGANLSAGTPATDPFPYGLASGDVDQRSVTLWTRPADDLAGQPVEWFCEPLDGADGAGDDRRGGTVTTGPERDLTVHVTVDDLAPGTAYRYGFRVDGRSVEGTTRTLPQRADHLRFVVACCSRYGWPGFERYGAIIAEEPAFVLHLGDYIYESGGAAPGGPLPDPPHECHTLLDYRRRHRQHRRHEALRRLHATVPFIATWDDHEVVNNAPAAEAPERLRAGLQAWREWLPMQTRHDDPESPGTPTLRANDRWLRVDGLLDLALLDTRFGGRRPVETDGPVLQPDHGPLLDDRQWNELSSFAEGANAPWFVAASQVQVGPMVLGWLPSPRRRPPWRPIVNPDQWDGHPGERRRLYEVLGQVPGQPVILSGDLHSAWSRTLRHDDRDLATEFTAPSISGESYGSAFRSRTRLPSAVLRLVLEWLNPGVDLLDLERHGYLVCDVTPTELSVTFVLGHPERGGVERIRRTIRPD